MRSSKATANVATRAGTSSTAERDTCSSYVRIWLTVTASAWDLGWRGKYGRERWQYGPVHVGYRQHTPPATMLNPAGAVQAAPA